MSNITDSEYITLIASLKYLYEKQFRCFSSDKYDEEKRPEMVKEHNEKRNSCHSIKQGRPTTNHRYNQLNFLTCVCNFYDPSVNTLIDLQDYWDKHGMSDLICIKDTYRKESSISAKLMQYFKIIGNFKIEQEIKQQKEQEREYKQKAGIR